MQRARKRSTSFSTRLPPGTGKKFRAELEELLAKLPQDDFKVRYLQEEIFSKYTDLTTVPASVRRESAVTKWAETERRNAKTNFRLFHSNIVDREFGWTTYSKFIEDVRSIISRILGPLPYPSILQMASHTNGASTRVRRSPAAAPLKLVGVAHCSSSAHKHWIESYNDTIIFDQCIELREASVLFTVPKRTDIDRVACKEPEINMLLQRSVGNYLRRRLLQFGINLNDQTVNQRLAAVAVQRGLATVDLSSASDSITRELVIQLLPPEWWALLDDLRVKSCTVDSTSHTFEMFSSMGNGFTFELESLIFYAITRAVAWRSGVKGRISVYGDDIICPSRIVPRLARIMSFLGFTMNPKKTHYRGSFRESCGRHYWRGADVTPFYIRKEVDELPDLINHLNHLLEWDGRGWGFFINEESYEFWIRWSRLVPQALRGGIRPEDPMALVTGENPRKRLVPRTKPIPYPPEGGLKYWHLSRQHTELPLSVDPSKPYAYRLAKVVSLGERTSWDPGLIHRHRDHDVGLGLTPSR